jgi:hypothetical protein
MTRKLLYEKLRAQGHKGISKYTKAQLLELYESGDMPSPGKRRRGGARKSADKVASQPLGIQDRPSSGAVSAEAANVSVQSAGAAREIAAQEPSGVYVDWGYELPGRYGTDRISAFAKDPNWIFAHWDLSGRRKEEVVRERGPEVLHLSKWCLRVTDLDTEEHMDLPVSVEAGNWYVPVSEDGTFRIEIGLVTGQGEFLAFACTRSIRTPRSRPSERVSEKWLVADEEFQRFLKHAGETGSSGLSSGELAERIRAKFQE